MAGPGDEGGEAEVMEDPRLQFMAAYVLKALRTNDSKWNKMAREEENAKLLHDFIDKAEPVQLVVVATPAGALTLSTEWPLELRGKACYFVKKSRDPLGKDVAMRAQVHLGDLSYSPVHQLSTFIDEVVTPLLGNQKNQSAWPVVVSQDLQRHVHELKQKMFVVTGQVEGKTLLPLPVGIDHLDQALRDFEENGHIDMNLVHAFESVVIDWSYQIRDVTKKDSSQPILDGSNPTPKVEIAFWRTKAESLECIYDQLRNPQVRRLAEFLEKTKSTYFIAFKNIFREVVAALEESQNINRHLLPLQNHFQDFEQADFDNTGKLLAPMMHCVCLVWAHSDYYRNPARVIVLLQEMCNMIIECATEYLDPLEIFKGEIEEELEKAKKALQITTAFKTAFFAHQVKVKDYFRNGTDIVEWEFTPKLVFARYDRFLHRIESIVDLFETSLDFMRLEKVGYGGIKGKMLTELTDELHKEFIDQYNVFSTCTYNCLDLSDQQFEEDYASFRLALSDMDRRLARLTCMAFEDCCNLEAAFRLMAVYGALLERPMVKEEFDKNYAALIVIMEKELLACRLLYDRHMQSYKNGKMSDLHKNMPPVAGHLKWSSELKDRMDVNMVDFKRIEHPCMESEEADVVFRLHETLMNLLTEFEKEIYEKWLAGVDEACSFNLNQPLLTRNPETNLISVNFAPELQAVLREAKYFEQRHCEEIPEAAAKLYERHDEFRKHGNNLDLIVLWYNKVRTTTLEVEYALIEKQLQDIDAVLQRAENDLNWNSEGLDQYIEETRDMMGDLEVKTQKCKDNVACIEKLMAQWNEAALVVRRDHKKNELLYKRQEVAQHAAKRYAEISAAGKKVHELVQQNLELFHADITSDEWKAYVETIDDSIVDGFATMVECSLDYLIQNTEENQLAALAEIQFLLQAPYMVFSRAIEFQVPDGFYDVVDSLLGDIFKQCAMIQRVAIHKEEENCNHYQLDIEEMPDLVEKRNKIMERVTTVLNEAEELRKSYEPHAYLWVDDRTEFMRQFLLYNHVLTTEEIEEHAETGVPEVPPTLAQFKEQIDTYEKIYEEIETIPNTRKFHSWFKIDVKPFKQSLLNTIKRWSLMFKQHLIDHVTNSLADLEQFIAASQEVLGRPVQEGEYEQLVTCMQQLSAVRERQASTDEMFEPLKKTIELLRENGQELPEEVHEQLQELPEKWNNTKKTSIDCKQQVAPLQAKEVTHIRARAAAFDVAQHDFKEHFHTIPPFFYDCQDAYEHLDIYQVKLVEMERDMAALQEAASLFEVPTGEYKQLKACRREIRLLKALWDYIEIVQSSIEDWKTTPWQEIAVDQMESNCKKFAYEIRNMDKEMRAWNTFIGLEKTVKNMIISLKAVSELQNPAIRDRHWQQLMQATGVRFTMDENTTLADLLALDLHLYEDQVQGIVDKAVKEMAMEKMLRELDVTWGAMEFEHEQHATRGITMLKADDELIETLEENQVQLQNMLTSKYIGFFLKEVSEWQHKLSTADQVIVIWFEVQHTWSYLESIFIGSEDIRNQLPEDSKRFDGIDEDFRELVGDVERTKNVVEATNMPSLYEKLEAILAKLTICEKALAEYLETKRLVFPRFYFCSSADLLDILSNGNAPSKVQRHLTKLFDSMARLKFIEDDQSEPSKHVTGMWSKDGEYVDLASPCDLSGQVEVWLNRLLAAMKATVHHEMNEAQACYEEKPREHWIFDYPAQVALVGTQVWWTTEVNMAFARLEEGYENALKEYNKKQIAQLNSLISLLLGELSAGDRQKIMTICTIDVHARDVVTKLITQKVTNAQAFTWLCQLRHRWDDSRGECYANICDAQFTYAHEYLGNTTRLVITPLTDRCYITLTQSLHLTMSGAPAGPAGTGKTETTKDLGRALGIMVYVFNCSEQMDYKSVGNIYKGLAQSGAWGCFDEFNRIAVEVLSVVAVQVKSIQDAIKAEKQRFVFQGEEISLEATVGIFITMNPGYAGRTELPENLKALFRPCAMVVPDFELIAEIMMVAEGFTEARLLARKFITLYSLCKELLSKQDHYDWGLRAIKSVLTVAGALRRGDSERPEDQVLMRALRDFNTPKIVSDDLPVFMGLIGDLFPALSVPRKRNMTFEKEIKKAVVDLKLQPEDSFVLKVVQLQELIDVRHSVFIIGNAGTGKTCVWKSLLRANKNMHKKPLMVDLNPKAVTNDELFGVINQSTREWKDGLFSTIMRDLANHTDDGPKWIVLDGDIDPMWIESLNTVMDDNKVLTLASNERITLTPSMRLMFEISHLKTANPSTVSRAGILYVNPADLGWNPYVSSWIDTRELQSERANLTILFDKYVPACLEVMRTRFKKITPIADISHLQMLCNLLECMLTPENTPPDCAKELYELYFVFCAVWAFGGSLFHDQLLDHRVDFTKWWTSEFKVVKFPSGGTVFDYFIDPVTKKLEPWNAKVEPFTLDPEQPLQAAVVTTSETARIRFLLDVLVARGRPVMLVGGAGTGKTVLINDKLAHLGDEWLVTNVPFNFYTNSEMLQGVLEKPLERKTGRNFGPPGMKRLIYFIDDMNMPEVDKYFTVQPHTLIRQHLDYSHWYDRQKLTQKEIHNTQYVSCMNPYAGSFTINPRLQRHFAVLAISFPGQAALHSIYNSIMSQHLQHGGFASSVVKSSATLIHTAILLHNKIAANFLPTAIKFHYVFNLRDLSNIFQGMLYATPECVRSPLELARLWAHETQRVYRDKLVDAKDQELFNKLHTEVAKNAFQDLEEREVFAEPLLYSHFAHGDGKYMPVTSLPDLTKHLVDVLQGYNEVNAQMDLVLFEDAVFHVLRINRILESPRGNALLIGVGGSGKQSLSRLASFISDLEVFQITLRKGYGVNELKVDLAALCMRAGVKSVPTTFLLTDSQIADEKFLVLVNDLLASGEIPGLYADDEIDTIINGVRNEVKGLGIMDTRENCWKFFINRVRRQLKVVLCFSPVGNTLRVRARKFPAIVNCTCIDWFHSWPAEALVSVSRRFLEEVDLLTPEMADAVSQFMSHVHGSVDEVSSTYMRNERRYNYTTPKSFLEQIYLYKSLLTIKQNELMQNMQRLENGLERLESTSQQVEDLKEKLAAQEEDVNIKNQAAQELLVRVGAETHKTNAEKEIADAEELKVQAKAQEVKEKQEICEEDLRKAEPALIAAQEALNTLNKENIGELKAFPSPKEEVVDVTAAVLCLFPTRDHKPPRDRTWRACRAMIGGADDFIRRLREYDKDNIPDYCLKAVQPYLNKTTFDPEVVRVKSTAAAGLCSWVQNIVIYYNIYCDVKPKRDALEEANRELSEAQKKLTDIKAKVSKLEAEQQKLQDQFREATEAKLECQRTVEQTNRTIELANRLVGGLASENVRWGESIEKLKGQESTLAGDVLLIAAFVSYAGCFTKRYRTDMMERMWLPALQRSIIRVTPALDPLTMLTDDATIATWNNESLPSDRMSTENATILANCERWPLMIDPQLQGIKWIKQRYGEDLVVIRLGQKNYLDVIERAIASGDTVLLENIEETVDPVLDPLLGRNTIKKGRAIKLGDKEIDYSPSFRLILHTKLANPHYKPEMQAQTTLINFTVTRDGLEDQLLAAVVGRERRDLEEMKALLTKQQNEYKIKLKELEDNLLARLSTAQGNFLGDYELVESLESTKRTAVETENKVKDAQATEQTINETREVYRAVAARSSLLYFILNDLHKIHPMYQFSLKAFSVVFNTAIDKAEQSDTLQERVDNLIDCITYSVFLYTSRGLFEKDKLIFASQMVFLILMMKNEIDLSELDFLLRYPADMNVTSPMEFLSNSCWGGIKSLSLMDEFQNLERDIEGSPKRWKKFVESECPEKEKFPQEWKNKSSLQKLCMMRCLRPDRMTYAMTHFIEEHMGSRYTELRQVEFATSFKESGPSTPIFFILSPGVDPLKDVEALGRKKHFSQDRNNFHNISLGQGQEPVAEAAMELAATEGHWVVLQNVHLVAKWLSSLEKKLEESGENAHADYRVFISAEPAPTHDLHIIPQGILESAVKITNEPPTGMLANLHQALDSFDQDTLEKCSRELEFKSILFSLCYFHAVVCERRKFGPQGWNSVYPFNTGDLTISCDVLYNYLEANPKVPWEDLRYLFGQIMYGGHITDDWDRRLCRTYLEEYMNPDILEGELYLAPGFPTPPNSDYEGYHAYIDENLPPESPYLYGLHPNAEIEFLTMTSENLFRTVLEMQPRDAGAGGASAASRDEKIKALLDDILVNLPDEFNVQEIQQKVPVDERTPYTIVAFQECERMNSLTTEMKRSLKELDLGLKGELTITADMEALGDALYLDTVPERWASLAYPSLHGLSQWYADLQQRIKQLEHWSTDFQLPAAVWLAGLFNPQSMLTAIMQQTARKNEWPLDKMALQCDVTKKSREDIGSAPREGAYVHGLYMEGARWSIQTGMIAEAHLKELNPAMPVLFVKAVPVERLETRSMYECPVYKTKQRGPTYVWTFNLKTKEKAAKWILGGVALILQI